MPHKVPHRHSFDSVFTRPSSLRGEAAHRQSPACHNDRREAGADASTTVATRRPDSIQAMKSQHSAPLRELQMPDEATLAFNSFGLGGRLEPEDAAEFQAATIALAVLADNCKTCAITSSATQAAPIRLLEYEFFTAAGDYALLVLEGALRVRFLAFYSDGIPLVRAEDRGPAACERRSRTCSKHAAPRLRGADGTTHRLPLGADALLSWARREQLLAGTRAKIIEGLLSERRNHAAHPVGHTINMPVDSARTLPRRRRDDQQAMGPRHARRTPLSRAGGPPAEGRRGGARR